MNGDQVPHHGHSPDKALPEPRHAAARVGTIRGCSRQEQTPAGASRCLIIIITHTEVDIRSSLDLSISIRREITTRLLFGVSCRFS